MNMSNKELYNENNSVELSNLIRKFVKSYTNKNEKLDDIEWLKDEIKSELNDISDEEAYNISKQCFEEAKKNSENLRSLNEAVESGESKESWLDRKLKEASVGMSVNQYGEYLKSINDTIAVSNMQMYETVVNTRGDFQISKNMNLDGFIAEQYHVSSFNMNAKLNNSSYRAKVLEPKPGETYAKNSFDVVIVDAKDKIVHQYQLKYGKTAEHTIDMIKKGNYSNQRLVVPEEQVEAVRKAFPGKSIEGHIGGTDKVDIKSNSLTKSQAKEIQNETQNKGNIHQESWNSFTTKELTMSLAKNAGRAGMMAAAMGSGFEIAGAIAKGEKIEADEVVYNALVTGTDAGIKAAATGALKVGVEKGIVSVIPKGTPVGILSSIVCVGIENVKIMAKVMNGEMTSAEAIDKMGLTTTSMVCGLARSAKGAAIGSAMLAFIPVVGPVVGGLVGGTVGYVAGSKVGEGLRKVSKKVSNKAKEVVKGFGEKVYDTGRKAMSHIKSGLSKAGSFIRGKIGW